MIFPMCKKNLCYILVKNMLENMPILTVFLVMGFACLRNMYGRYVVCGSVAPGLEILIRTIAVYLSQAL